MTKMRNSKRVLDRHRGFCHWNSGFVADFDIRISGFLVVLFVAICLPVDPLDAGSNDERSEASTSDSNDVSSEAEVAFYRYKVIRSYPHDRKAFTQGLVYGDGLLYEGTGLRGQSAITRRNLETGKTVKRLRLPDKYFGEGITIFGDRLIQLTWKSNVGFVYQKDTFTLLGQFTYPTQGWGITQDGKRLILSDGSATVRFLDPNTYAETGRVEVRDRGRPVRRINELEFITDAEQHCGDGRIYANIWPTDYIAIIHPKTGRVTGWIDLTGLYTPSNGRKSEDVPNGIAYIPETKRLLVTGKLWPKLYEIELTPQSSNKEQ